MTRAATWPTDQLYWASFDASVLPRRHRQDPVRLGYLLEGLLPVPLEAVHPVYDVRGHVVVACAIEREVLERALERREAARWTTLRPDGPPPESTGISRPVDPARFDFLSGPYRPASIARRDRAIGLVAVLGIVLVTALAVVGLQRRADVVRAAEAAVRAEFEQQLRAAVPAGLAPPDASTGRLELALESERARLQRTRVMDGTALPEDVDATRALTAVFAAWPEAPGVRVRTVQSSGDVVRLSGLAATPSSVEAVRAALDAAPGWRARTTSAEQRQAAVVTFDLEVTRRPDGAGAAEAASAGEATSVGSTSEPGSGSGSGSGSGATS